MSRGTRPHGDVYSSSWEDYHYSRIHPYPYPDEFSYPAGFECGTGREKTLYRCLMVEYNNAFKSGNDLHYQSKTSECYSDRGLTGQASHHSGNAKEAKDRMDHACKRAMTVLNQMNALGIRTYIPPVLRNLVKAPNLLTFGSFSYLARPAYCYSPEEFSVPAGLPGLRAGDNTINYIFSIKSIKSVAAANSYLSKKYGLVAIELNNVRFFRDWRIRQGLGFLQEVPHNPLTSRLLNIYTQLDLIVELMNQFKSSSDDLFKIPQDLRDLALSDPVVMSLLSKEHFSCLHPSHQLAKEKVMYVLHISDLGLGLFQLYGFDSSHQDVIAAQRVADDVTSFRLAVKLTVFYPFPNDEDGRAKYNTISEGVCTNDLKLFIDYFLPKPNEKDYVVGVRHRKIATIIASETALGEEKPISGEKPASGEEKPTSGEKRKRS
ncbi:hypothetical protein U9M48_035175 [Paspalum notatum var. saurae]|uniref:Uncharacterized protein n=1 Tax=Paspalum notatum var. saurae TaxID=547442 RepID=A0AAQ3UAS7_PASNO